MAKQALKIQPSLPGRTAASDPGGNSSSPSLVLASHHLSVSVSHHLMSFTKHFETHRQETDNTIITRCYGSVLYEGIDSHNEHSKSERWEEMWEQKRRKLDYNSDREKSSRWQGFRDLGKHSDISVMVSVRKIVKNMTRRA